MIFNFTKTFIYLIKVERQRNIIYNAYRNVTKYTFIKSLNFAHKESFPIKHLPKTFNKKD